MSVEGKELCGDVEFWRKTGNQFGMFDPRNYQRYPVAIPITEFAAGFPCKLAQIARLVMDSETLYMPRHEDVVLAGRFNSMSVFGMLWDTAKHGSAFAVFSGRVCLVRGPLVVLDFGGQGG